MGVVVGMVEIWVDVDEMLLEGPRLAGLLLELVEAVELAGIEAEATFVANGSVVIRTVSV